MAGNECAHDKESIDPKSLAQKRKKNMRLTYNFDSLSGLVYALRWDAANALDIPMSCIVVDNVRESNPNETQVQRRS